MPDKSDSGAGPSKRQKLDNDTVSSVVIQSPPKSIARMRLLSIFTNTISRSDLFFKEYSSNIKNYSALIQEKDVGLVSLKLRSLINGKKEIGIKFLGPNDVEFSGSCRGVVLLHYYQQKANRRLALIQPTITGKEMIWLPQLPILANELEDRCNWSHHLCGDHSGFVVVSIRCQISPDKKTVQSNHIMVWKKVNGKEGDVEWREESDESLLSGVWFVNQQRSIFFGDGLHFVVNINSDPKLFLIVLHNSTMKWSNLIELPGTGNGKEFEWVDLCPMSCDSICAGCYSLNDLFIYTFDAQFKWKKLWNVVLGDGISGVSLRYVSDRGDAILKHWDDETDTENISVYCQASKDLILTCPGVTTLVVYLESFNRLK